MPRKPVTQPYTRLVTVTIPDTDTCEKDVVTFAARLMHEKYEMTKRLASKPAPKPVLGVPVKPAPAPLKPGGE